VQRNGVRELDGISCRISCGNNKALISLRFAHEGEPELLCLGRTVSVLTFEIDKIAFENRLLVRSFNGNHLDRRTYIDRVG
jgi:hypothetical protein